MSLSAPISFHFLVPSFVLEIIHSGLLNDMLFLEALKVLKGCGERSHRSRVLFARPSVHLYTVSITFAFGSS